jgi:glycine cleavage system H protein
VVSVLLPPVNSELVTGVEFGEIESTKVVRDLISPVSGTVTAINQRVCDDPTSVNGDPYGEGWLLGVAPSAEA